MAALLQKSPEWFAARVGKVTSSVTGSILGHSPYQTRDDVMRVKVREAFGAPQEFTGNAATAHGEKFEPYARRWYEMNHNQTVQEIGQVLHREHDWLAASPDGLVGLDGAVEIKCPFYSKKPYSVFEPKKKMYLDQCLFMIHVCDLEWIDFVCWVNDDVAKVERVNKSDFPHWWEASLPVLKKFKDELDSIIAEGPKGLRAKAYLTDKKEFQLTDVDDPLLERLALLTEILQAHEDRVAPVREEFDQLKVRVWESFGRCSNGRVSINCTERKGSMDWKKVIDEIGGEAAVSGLLPPDKSLETFRRKAQFVYEVKLEGDKK